MFGITKTESSVGVGAGVMMTTDVLVHVHYVVHRRESGNSGAVEARKPSNVRIKDMDEGADFAKFYKAMDKANGKD